MYECDISCSTFNFVDAKTQNPNWQRAHNPFSNQSGNWVSHSHSVYKSFDWTPKMTKNSGHFQKLKFILVSVFLSAHSIFALAITSPGKRTVLVTGGAGYIGSHTCLELLNLPDYNVVVVDSLDNSSEESLSRVKELTGCDPERLQFRNCDIRDKEGLRKGNA